MQTAWKADTASNRVDVDRSGNLLHAAGIWQVRSKDDHRNQGLVAASITDLSLHKK